MAVFRFGPYELDPAARELRRDGVVQALQPKAFDVLAHLVRNRHRAVGREELLRAVWPDVRVTPASVSRALKSARRALGDDGRRQTLIRTLAGGRVRFVAPLARDAAVGGEGESAYVGRSDTLARLRERLAAACAGRGGVLLLAGEPGIGKTRTASELLARAADEGAATLVVHAHGGEGALPFWPWHAVLARLVPDAPPAASALPAHAPGDAQLRMFDALRRALARAASRAPLVLLLDDLHEADEASIVLLDALLPDLAAQPVLVLGTLRSDEAAARPAIAAAFARLERRPGAERVTIPPLGAGEVAALAARITGAALPEAEAARLAELTAGNPLWVAEALALAEPAAEAGSGGLAGLGPSLERTIAARLALIPKDAARLLEAAAVLGAGFDPTLAARVAGMAPRTARRALEAARARRLVAPPDPAAPSLARFAHPLFREVLYRRLAATDREALHARAAATLEALGDAAPAAAVADHLLAAGESASAAQAAGWGARAGALAERAGAFERAAGLYEGALRRAGDARAEPKAACELAIALARTRRRLGDPTAAEPAARAMRWAQQRGWPRLHAEAALAFAGPMDGYRPPRREITSALEAALAVLGPDNRDLRARLLARLAAEECFLPGAGRRAALGREALEVARTTGDVLLEAEVADTPFAGIHGGLAGEELRALGERLLRAGEETQREGVVLLARLLRLHDRLADADVAGFDAELALAEALARALRDPVAGYRLRLYSAMRALLAGDAAGSEALAVEAFAMAGHGRYEGAAGFLGAQLVLARADQGRLAEALPLLERDAELRPGPSSRTFLAWAYAEAEDLAGCRRALQEIAVRDLPTLDRFSWCTANAVMLARACWFARSFEHAPALEALLAGTRRPIAVRGNITAHGPVAWAQALLAAARGDAPAARERFAQALAVARAMGAVPWIQRIERDLERSALG